MSPNEILALPALLLGIYIGNRTFFRISEKIFGIVLGGVLMVLLWGLILELSETPGCVKFSCRKF